MVFFFLVTFIELWYFIGFSYIEENKYFRVYKKKYELPQLKNDYENKICTTKKNSVQQRKELALYYAAIFRCVHCARYK